MKCKMLRRKTQASLFLLATFSSLAVCDDSFGLRLTTESVNNAKENTRYSFHYFVKDDTTGDYKTQKETKEGDSVHGSYTLAEPNGDLRTVTYKAAPGTGFEAKVDVQPSASPMKPITEATAFRTAKTERSTQSNVSYFPGGFQMNVSSNPEVKTEMEMKFSLKTNPITEPVTGSTKTVTTEPSETQTENTQPNYDEMTTENVESSESSTLPDVGREIGEDPIEKEIDEAINSMPKLPELVLADNKTHLKFQKDPEEALLDERITQIARQLAETSLRRENEERKLGHFIPISVVSIEPRTMAQKSIKFTKSDSPSTLNVLPHSRIIPQYIYKQTLFPEMYRIPVVNKPILKLEEQTVTNPPDILKLNKNSKLKGKKFDPNINIGATRLEPVNLQTFFQLFGPYLTDPPLSYPVHKTEQTKNRATSSVNYNTVLYTTVTPANDKIQS